MMKIGSVTALLMVGLLGLVNAGDNVTTPEDVVGEAGMPDLTPEETVPIPEPKKGVRSVCGEGWGHDDYKIIVEAQKSSNIVVSMCWDVGCEAGKTKHGKTDIYIFTDCPELSKVKAVIVGSDEEEKDVAIGKITLKRSGEELFTEDCFDENECGKVKKHTKVDKTTCAAGKDEGHYEYITLAPETFVYWKFPSDEPVCGDQKTGVHGERKLNLRVGA